MEKQYSYIEVILKLREEYQKNEKELEILKQYIELDDPKVLDYYFRCSDVKRSPIILDRDVKKSFFEKFKEKYCSYINLGTITECHKNSDGNYYFKKGEYKNPIITNQEGFDAQIKKILNSDFGKYAHSMNPDFNDGVLWFTFGGIYINYIRERLDYFAKEDFILVENKLRITDDFIKNLFNRQIPESYLNDWQKQIIDNSEPIDIFVYPEIHGITKNIELSIEKENNKVLLKRKVK